LDDSSMGSMVGYEGVGVVVHHPESSYEGGGSLLTEIPALPPREHTEAATHKTAHAPTPEPSPSAATREERREQRAPASKNSDKVLAVYKKKYFVGFLVGVLLVIVGSLVGLAGTVPTAWASVAMLGVGSLLIIVPILLLRCGWRNHKMGKYGREGLKRKRRGAPIKIKKMETDTLDRPGEELGL